MGKVCLPFSANKSSLKRVFTEKSFTNYRGGFEKNKGRRLEGLLGGILFSKPCLSLWANPLHALAPKKHFFEGNMAMVNRTFAIFQNFPRRYRA